MDRSKATVLVKVRFPDKDRRMLPDMSAKVSFLPRTLAPEEMKPRLATGRSALIDRNGRTFAYLLEGNRVRETPVRVGATFGDMVEIHPPPLLRKIRRVGWKQVQVFALSRRRGKSLWRMSFTDGNFCVTL